jgi:hypothetical protein
MEGIMKNRLILCLFLLLAWTAVTTGQEAVVGGGMTNESDWFVYDMGSGTTPSTAEFNYTADTCAFGKGGCLHLSGVGTYSNILVWQAVTLEGAKTYEISGAFRELTGDTSPEGTWVQIYISTEMPVEGTDYKPPAGANTDRYVGFNSWVDKTWGGIDGTFQEDGLEKDDGQKIEFYTAPGNAGESVEAYFGIKAGVWSGAAELVLDCLLDELSLNGGSTAVESKTGPRVKGFALEPNYPNPFNPVTHFTYSLPRASSVTVKVYNLHGEEVLNPVNGAQQAAGQHRLTIDASGLNSGVYVCRLQTADGILARKMTVVK